MTERPDFDELVAGGLSADERADLERVDRLLRAAGPPPAEIPSSLTRAVERIGTQRVWTRRRAAFALALAATLAAVFFGVGRWTDSDSTRYRASIEMHPASSVQNASARIKLGEREPSGNWKLELQVDGLPRLPGDRYYVLWLAKDGHYAATCGGFNVQGHTVVDMTASYRLSEYDAWVISEAEPNSPWLLTAKI
jgi:Anti-sigma-K factor rskA